MMGNQADMASNAAGLFGQSPAADAHFAGGRPQQCGDNAHQRALPGSVWPNKGDEFAFGNGQVDRAQNWIEPVLFDEAAETDHEDEL